MGLRDNGVTVDEFMLAGHCKPAFNNMRAMVKMGVITIEPVGAERPIRQKFTITPRGLAFIEAQIKANEAETAATKAAPKVKAKAVAKAKKAKAAADAIDPSKPEPVTSAFVHGDGEVTGDLGIEGPVTATKLSDGSVLVTTDTE